MGPDQLGVALMLPSSDGDNSDYQQARALMARFAGGILDGLAKLGVAADFQGKNDIEVGGRKLAGLGIHKTANQALLFHASVLVGTGCRNYVKSHPHPV